jgi:ATP/maltotriose-dependent transcriptional regulator MalT
MKPRYDVRRNIARGLETRLRQVELQGGTSLRVDAEDLRTVLNLCERHYKKISALERKVKRVTAEGNVREQVAFHSALADAESVSGLLFDSDSLWAEYAEEVEV